MYSQGGTFYYNIDDEESELIVVENMPMETIINMTKRNIIL